MGVRFLAPVEGGDNEKFTRPETAHIPETARDSTVGLPLCPLRLP